MKKHTLLQKAAISLLETLGDQLWGFRPNVIAPFVEQKGAFPAVFWILQNMLKYERILDPWGPIRTHLLVTEISTLNGCAYCTNGHAYALQLHYLKIREALFPLSEADILALHGLPDAEIIQRFEKVLEQVDLPLEILDLRRMSELWDNPALTTTQKDKDICQLITMFGVLNACGVYSKARIDQAHDPINKERIWRDRYANRRAAQQRQPAMPAEPSLTILNPNDFQL